MYSIVLFYKELFFLSAKFEKKENRKILLNAGYISLKKTLFAVWMWLYGVKMT